MNVACQYLLFKKCSQLEKDIFEISLLLFLPKSCKTPSYGHFSDDCTRATFEKSGRLPSVSLVEPVSPFFGIKRNLLMYRLIYYTLKRRARVSVCTWDLRLVVKTQLQKLCNPSYYARKVQNSYFTNSLNYFGPQWFAMCRTVKKIQLRIDHPTYIRTILLGRVHCNAVVGAVSLVQQITAWSLRHQACSCFAWCACRAMLGAHPGGSVQ